MQAIRGSIARELLPIPIRFSCEPDRPPLVQPIHQILISSDLCSLRDLGVKNSDFLMAEPRKPQRRQLDIRPILARGDEPYPWIRPLVMATEPGDELLIVSPFLPSPLIERLQSDGFEVRPDRGADGSWHTLFRRP
jgi:hypothetical protein